MRNTLGIASARRLRLEVTNQPPALKALRQKRAQPISPEEWACRHYTALEAGNQILQENLDENEGQPYRENRARCL